MKTGQRATLIIAASGGLAPILRRVLDRHEWIGLPAVLLTAPNPRQFDGMTAQGSQVIDALRRRGVACHVLVPPQAMAGALAATRGVEWTAVDLPNPTSRLDRVWLPVPLTDASALIAINSLAWERRSRDPIAIGIWSKFAHPRQRAGAQ